MHTPPQTRLAETGARCASFIAALQRSEAEAAGQRDALLALQQGAARLRAEAGRAAAARDVAERRLKEETEGTKARAMEAVRAAEAGRSRLLVRRSSVLGSPNSQGADMWGPSVACSAGARCVQTAARHGAEGDAPCSTRQQQSVRDVHVMLDISGCMRQVEKGAVEHDLDAAVRAAEAAEKLAAERGAALAAAVWRVRELEAAAADSGAGAASLGVRSRSPATLRKPPHLHKLLAPTDKVTASAAAGGSKESMQQQAVNRVSPPALGPTTPVAATAPLPALQESSSSGGDSPIEEPPAPLHAARSGSSGLRLSRSLSRRLSSGPGFATLADADLSDLGLCHATSLASSVDAFFDARSDAGSALSAPGGVAVAMLQASHAVLEHARPLEISFVAHGLPAKFMRSGGGAECWHWLSDVSSERMQLLAGEAGGAAGEGVPAGAGEGAGRVPDQSAGQHHRGAGLGCSPTAWPGCTRSASNCSG